MGQISRWRAFRVGFSRATDNTWEGLGATVGTIVVAGLIVVIAVGLTLLILEAARWAK